MSFLKHEVKGSEMTLTIQDLDVTKSFPNYDKVWHRYTFIAWKTWNIQSVYQYTTKGYKKEATG